MNTPHKQESWKFVEAEKVVSKPGAKITVKELILTEKGLEAITSGSSGIKEGAVKIHGPHRNKRDLEPA